jgi:hypothetical protein
VIDLPPKLTAALEQLTPGARSDLLRALVTPERARLELIRHLYESEDTRQVAELLIDLKADPWARSIVIEAPTTNASP